MADDPFADRGVQDGAILTASRLCTLWLRLFGGYKVETIRRLPKESALGQLYYKTHWVLVKKS